MDNMKHPFFLVASLHGLIDDAENLDANDMREAYQNGDTILEGLQDAARRINYLITKHQLGEKRCSQTNKSGS